MGRDLERRLARAETAAHALGEADVQAGRRRCSLRALGAVCDIIRDRLVAMKIDPELAVSLRRGEEAAAELAAIPDTATLQAADAAIMRADHGTGGDGARQFWAKMERMAEQYRDGRRPNFANASPAELFAFIVAAEGRAADGT
jgi:hypothetical protein